MPPRRTLAPRIRRDKVVLRVIGRSEILLAEIRRQAAEDLDLDIRFELVDGLAASQRATTRPDSFDVYHQGHTVDLIWTARSIRPIDLRRIPAWSEVAQLAELGEGERRIFHDVFEQVYVQEDGRLGGRPTERASMLPAIHGVDAPGYLPIVRAELAAGEADSWAWLLDDRWRGRVALLSDASLGMIEAALAAEASGLAEFRSMANLSIEEIDAIVGILIAKKRAGHFRALWETYDEAVALMEKGEVAIQSIFSPTVIELQRRGVAVRTAVPSEGYRGWHSDLCISARAQGATLDAAYAYLNWWMEGAAGAMLARQGYYASTRERARRYLSVGEWEYWYEGKPASQELAGADGRGGIAVGSLRDGGSYFARMSGVRVWNTFMDEHNYLTRRWNDFLAA
jgi:putative spermidine/putrescine transport system substrate-binding protein